MRRLVCQRRQRGRFLAKWKVVPVGDVVTNDLVEEMNAIDQAKVEANAKAWKP